MNNARHSDQDVRPIPLSERRGIIYPALVWSGFTAAFACLVVGNRLQFALGTINALVAVVLGSWLLFVYSAAIGFACGRWGLNFQFMLKAIFGRVGAIVPGLLLTVLVTGWFSYHLMMTAEILLNAVQAARAEGRIILVICTGAVFALPVVMGQRNSFIITVTVFPAMLIFAAITLVRTIIPVGATLIDGPLDGHLPFATGVAVAFGTFVVSGTMTGDIVRFCRSGNEAVQVTAVGFLFSNLPFTVLGVLIGAAGHDVIGLIDGGSNITIVLMAIAILSNWAACDACLTNAVVTLKSAFPGLPWLVVSAATAAVGIVVAVFAMIGDLFGWILFLSAVVPPVGGVIIADYYVVRVHQGFARGRALRVNVAALIALGAGIAAALAIMRTMPEMLVPLVGAVVSGTLYLMLAAVSPRRLGVELAHDQFGAEAID